MKNVASAILLLLLPSAVSAAEITGKPRVIDGTTIEISGQAIRLYGLDSPDLEQQCRTRRKFKPYPCGRVARNQFTHQITMTASLTCKGDSYDKQKRLVAVCYLRGLDLNRATVLSGWAVADPEQGEEYQKAEDVARKMRRGLWKNLFVRPSEWRKGERLSPPGAN